MEKNNLRIHYFIIIFKENKDRVKETKKNERM